MAGSCEHGNEHSGSINAENFYVAEQLLAPKGGLSSRQAGRQAFLLELIMSNFVVPFFKFIYSVHGSPFLCLSVTLIGRYRRALGHTYLRS
jgi:hypothetical protein